MSFSVLNTHNNTRQNSRSQTRPKMKEANTSWEGSFTQRFKKTEQLKEQTLKAQCSTGSLDHAKIDSMRTVTKSQFELLEEKELEMKEKSKKNKWKESNILDSTETAKLLSFRAKTQAAIDSDLEKLKKHKLTATVTTDFGRITKLLLVAIHLSTTDKPDMYDDIYYVYRRLSEFTIPVEIKNDKQYKDIFKLFEKLHLKIDTIEKQFNKYHGNMPPLNNREFTALDEWQKQYLDNIDINRSTIVQASTSAGKTILTGYGFLKKKKAIVCVPTDPLVWQTASMIGKITGNDIPIITKTYQTETARDELIKKIEQGGIVVGTAQYLNDFLPLINVDWDFIVIDEIHMIGTIENKEMELICKVYNNVPIVLLSATIGNVEELRDWMIKIGHTDIDIIKCEKRFFNLQRFYYDKSNQLIRIHPLSSVVASDVESGAILKKTMNVTPPDVWILAICLKNKCNIGDLDPYKYFTKTQVITLDEANDYFKRLLEWMVENYTKNTDIIKSILSSYNHDSLVAEKASLYDLSVLLKEQDKTPALIFRLDAHECLAEVREFSRTIRDKENAKYPDLLKIRLKQQSKAKAFDKKLEQMKIDGMGEKQIQKLMMADTFENETTDNISIYEPHPDFIFNKHQYFTQHKIDEWNNELKKFFPAYGSEYHYIIDLLWRGIGVYVKGLPDAYLHIIQNLACSGKLGIVFSDKSLVFGVSMPFRTSVITPDTKMNPMIYHQMSGRAGRRGLDKEGNVVFFNFSGKQIQELSTSAIPNITGCDTMFHGALYAEKLSIDKRWSNITKNFLLSQINEDADEFYSSIKDNLSANGGWNFANSDNKNFLHMCWRLRHSEDCFRIPFLISFIRKIYCNCNPSNENTQIEFAKFILQYTDIEAKNDSYVLTPVESSKLYNIHHHFEQLGLDVPKKIDSQLYESIRRNSIIDIPSKEKSILRERLFEFGEKIKILQHYFHFSNEIILNRLLSKLMTRMWWIYHMSSPVMESVAQFNTSDTDEESEISEECELSEEGPIKL